MPDLRLVGPDAAGTHLNLMDQRGRKFRLPVDEELKAAVRGDVARLSQLQLADEGTLRPREIQARIRAGESTEEIAERTGEPLEHLRRYEGPVVAERTFMANQARQLTAGTAQGRRRLTVDDIVTVALNERDITLEQVVWDAWRHDDGTWLVALTIHPNTAESERALWAYDRSRQHLAARNRLALDLFGDLSRDDSPMNDAGSIENESVGAPTRAVPKADAAPVEYLAELRERRGRRPQPATTSAPTFADEPVPVPRSASGRSQVKPTPVAPGQPQVLDVSTPTRGAELDATDTPARSRRKRASVPSWDDIVFGGKRE